MIDVPFLSYEQLKARAEIVLSESDHGDRFPVDIELIVESDFGIDIIPIFGLQNAYQIDAFISKDLKSITIDESVFDNRINRYRFSLAHELGHRVLHAGILGAIEFESTAEWKDLVSKIPQRQYGFLEYQANTFANALLVPQAELNSRLQQVVEKIKTAGLDPAEYPDECLDSISSELGRQFQVSSASMRIRLGNDRWLEQL